MNKKIKKLSELLKEVKKLKRQGKAIVTNNGCYDLLHYGHVRSLQEAAKQGDILIVGINSDSSVKKYKSRLRPIIPQNARAEMIAALECVDYVFIFNETTPIEFIKKIQPDIHTNGIEYGKNCIENAAVKSCGGKLHLLKKYQSLSTTRIIKKIIFISTKEKKLK